MYGTIRQGRYRTPVLATCLGKLWMGEKALWGADLASYIASHFGGQLNVPIKFFFSPSLLFCLSGPNPTHFGLLNMLPGT